MEDSIMSKRYAAQAEFHRAIARPKRLQILAILRNGEANVTELAQSMKVTPVSVSQDLAPLRNAGIVQSRRDGKKVHYRLSNPKVFHASRLMAEAMQEVIAARAAAVRLEDLPPHGLDRKPDKALGPAAKTTLSRREPAGSRPLTNEVRRNARKG
jgi:ArsR family transcriptional regulator